jgi:hypothetical protein
MLAEPFAKTQDRHSRYNPAELGLALEDWGGRASAAFSSAATGDFLSSNTVASAGVLSGR